MFSFRNVIIPVGAVETAYQSKVPSIKNLMSLSLTLPSIARPNTIAELAVITLDHSSLHANTFYFCVFCDGPT